MFPKRKSLNWKQFELIYGQVSMRESSEGTNSNPYIDWWKRRDTGLMGVWQTGEYLSITGGQPDLILASL